VSKRGPKNVKPIQPRSIAVMVSSTWSESTPRNHHQAYCWIGSRPTPAPNCNGTPSTGHGKDGSIMSRTWRFATTLMVSGGLGIALLGLSAGSGHAQDGGRQWCPGDDPRGGPGGPFVTSPPNWDWNVCHTYWIVQAGQGNVSPGIWADSPPPGLPPPASCGRDLFTGMPLPC
jgi:hypothetical protein